MSTLVLLSGGLDSAVLAAHEAHTSPVQPVYVSVGLAWEHDELAMIDRLLASPVFDGRVTPISRMEFTMRDVYPPHRTGRSAARRRRTTRRMKTSTSPDAISYC